MSETEVVTNVKELAAKALEQFETIRRGDETIWTRKDDAPEWVQDLCYEAHGDMLPDDWRYEFIVSALDIIAEGEGSEDPSDYSQAIDTATDVYNHDLYRWLGSNLNRASYVDEITEEIGHSDSGISGDVAMGQYREREEVLTLVLAWLADLSEDDA